MTSPGPGLAIPDGLRHRIERFLAEAAAGAQFADGAAQGAVTEGLGCEGFMRLR
jgi:hypothetical protein